MKISTFLGLAAAAFACSPVFANDDDDRDNREGICDLPPNLVTYIPHIGDAIWREFPPLIGGPIRLVRDAKQGEHLTLQLGEQGVEDLDGAVVAHERVPLGETE